MQQFPTLRCRCINNHEWESLVANYWFAVKDMECPECSSPVVRMKTGSYHSLDKIKQQLGEKANLRNSLES